MKRVQNRPPSGRQGSSLIIVLIFIGMFSALAVAMATMSGTNVQMAGNYGKLDGARAAAESGQDVMRYWMRDISFVGTTTPEHRMEVLASTLQASLTAADVNNVDPNVNGSTITIPNVPLEAGSGRSFSVVMTQPTSNELRMDVTGHYGGVDRTLRSVFLFGTRAHTIFDFGLGSNGPMYLSGKINVIPSDPALLVEANALILTTLGYDIALQMEGGSKIGGTVTLTDDDDCALIGNNAWVGNGRGTAAWANIVRDANTYYEFPLMVPGDFTSYATTTLTEPPTSGAPLNNIIVPPNMNWTFSGNTLHGVTYIKSPNYIRFYGGVKIVGVIVTDGNQNYNPDPNNPDCCLEFGANVDSFSVADLPPADPKFPDSLRAKIGTFIVAPGFFVKFTGNFGVLSGAIGCNGFSMGGGSGGVINGSVINYSTSKMYLSGNGDLIFNRTDTLYEVPAGFVPQTILHYNPLSYSEVPL